MTFKMKTYQKIILLRIFKNILNLFLIVWFGALLTEMLIPGFISGYLSFSRIISAILLIIISLYFLTSDFKLPEIKKESDQGTLFLILCFSLLVIIIASLDFSPVVIAVMSAILTLILFYFLKIILPLRK
ncbi:MAG: hypothetical protein V3574_03280 [Candidatus Moraniibacteriota bacterium]